MNMHSFSLSVKIKRKKSESRPKYSFTYVVKIQNTVLCSTQVQTTNIKSQVLLQNKMKTNQSNAGRNVKGRGNHLLVLCRLSKF